MPVEAPLATTQKAAAFYRDIQKLFGDLYYRWQDEKEYEDINEYGAAIVRNFPNRVEDLTMRKSPFAARFTIDGVRWEIKLSRGIMSLVSIGHVIARNQ